MLLIIVRWSVTLLKVYLLVTLILKASNTTTNLLNFWPTDRLTFKRKIDQSNERTRLLTLDWKAALHLTLIVTSAEVVETIVTVSNNSPFQDFSNQENQTTRSTTYYLTTFLSRELLVTLSFPFFSKEEKKSSVILSMSNTRWRCSPNFKIEQKWRELIQEKEIRVSLSVDKD